MHDFELSNARLFQVFYFASQSRLPISGLIRAPNFLRTEYPHVLLEWDAFASRSLRGEQLAFGTPLRLLNAFSARQPET